MIKSFYRAACIQMNSGAIVQENMDRARKLIEQAVKSKATLVVLPEFFPLLSEDETAKLAIAETDGDGPIQNFLSQIAQHYHIYLVGGTLPIVASSGNDNDGRPRVYSSSLFYAPNGERLLRYDKIHLFQFMGKQASYDETKTICAGEHVAAIDTPLGRLGMSVCYDLRFPELFRAMQSPDVIVAPSAFVPETGMAHWALLLRARAVENLAYVLGAAQVGTHPGNRQTYGHSMIINPWGEVIAHAVHDSEQVIVADIDATSQDTIRQRLPVLLNRKL